MSEHFNCMLCDKPNKYKSKKKHLNSQYHQALTKSIISRYHITNPNFLDVEGIFKNMLENILKDFDFLQLLVNLN